MHFFFPWEKKKIKGAVQTLSTRYTESALSCQATQKCLIVYMAPWCGACKQFLTEFLPELQTSMAELKSSNKAGLQFVIGMDQMEKLQSMAHEYSLPSFLSDQDKSIQKLFKVRVVPSFIGVDNQGNVLNFMDGFKARGETRAAAAQNFLKDILKL